MLGYGGDHSGIGDGDNCICSKVLVLLLLVAVDGQNQAWIYGLIELCYDVIDVGLADITVSVQDVIEESTDVNSVEAFVGVF